MTMTPVLRHLDGFAVAIWEQATSTMTSQPVIHLVMSGVVHSPAHNISVIAPKEAGAGKIEVQIDGQTRAMADLSTMDNASTSTGSM